MVLKLRRQPYATFFSISTPFNLARTSIEDGHVGGALPRPSSIWSPTDARRRPRRWIWTRSMTADSSRLPTARSRPAGPPRVPLLPGGAFGCPYCPTPTQHCHPRCPHMVIAGLILPEARPRRRRTTAEVGRRGAVSNTVEGRWRIRPIMVLWTPQLSDPALRGGARKQLDLLASA